MPKAMEDLIPARIIDRRILLIRGQKVMVDSDLAELYGVPTKVLNQAVKRNKNRFPSDFMFQLSPAEAKNLRSQIVTSSWGGRRYLPLVFTEHGALQLASVLNSPRAVEMSIYVVRAFVKLRELLATHKDLAQKLADFEKRLGADEDHIQSLYNAIHQLMEPPEVPKRRIGFEVKERKSVYAVNGRQGGKVYV